MKIRALPGLLLIMTAPIAGTLSCIAKVPLNYNPARFETVAAHWFENEQTQYLFFSVAGLRHGQARADWPSRFEVKLNGDSALWPSVFADAKTASDGYVMLDLSRGVHSHRLVECGEGRLCGSFSFHSEKPVEAMRLRFRYHVEAAMGETIPVPLALHPRGSRADSYSALVYGVFNRDNTRVQVRLHDNFGTPSSQEIEHFGLTRSFAIQSPYLVDMSNDEEKLLKDETQSAFLFPAEICRQKVSAKGLRKDDSVQTFAAHSFWTSTPLSRENDQPAACFNVRALDSKGRLLFETSAIARRNPELVDQPAILRPPLEETHKIPLVISYCNDRPESANLTSPEFLNYQKYVLNFPDAPLDICFATGEEERFERELSQLISAKLSRARAQFRDGRDFFIAVALNHRLSGLIGQFHAILAQVLGARIDEELTRFSPRLVGAFVYDSQPASARNFKAKDGIVWCPRAEATPETTRDFADANCLARDSGESSFLSIRTLYPLGPFPTERVFKRFSSQYGGRGQVSAPEFEVSSVKTQDNTTVFFGGDRPVTFIDGQRLTLQADQHLRFCPNFDRDHLLDSLAFRTTGEDGKPQILDSVSRAEALLKDGTRKATINMDIGIRWNSAYAGAFKFASRTKTTISDLIPITKSSQNQQRLGDRAWFIKEWNLTPLMQRCLRYCQHPYFDESGVYQMDQTWKSTEQCPIINAPDAS